MRPNDSISRGMRANRWLVVSLLVFGFCAFPALSQRSDLESCPPLGIILSVQGKVEVLPAGSAPDRWVPAQDDPPYNKLCAGDRLRTLSGGRATVEWSAKKTTSELGPNSEIHIAPRTPKRPGFNFIKGFIYFFHRDKPGEFDLQTPTVSAATRGTEFCLQVEADGTTILTMFEGEVEMRAAVGEPLVLGNREQGIAEPGKAPVKTAAIFSVNLIQWALYYPGVLNPDELPLSPAEDQLLSDSLTAYRAGDLLAAEAKYPSNRVPVSEGEKVYQAALLLSVGEVEQAQGLLLSVREWGPADDPARRLSAALEKMIAAVKFQAAPPGPAPMLATEWLAESYYQQSRFNLDAAREAAEKAAALAPAFGFAWERLAEMEFSFGYTRKARAAVENSRHLSPRNAQAFSLLGYLAAADNQIHEAIAFFDQALQIDSGLATAWLGRGLCHIRKGRTEEGRRQLQVAATLEPQRALYRSYLGKAMNQAGEPSRALHELGLAKQLDPGDPTAWLYSALIKQQRNQINEAVQDLEMSQNLNTNSLLYRSRLLVDKDRATRGANLASVYQDAGMTDVSLREAARAVNQDYANYSAHLFLAESYGALRDLHQIELRYETPWVNEYLVANLLSDSRAGTLSPYVTQQEYSKLLERDRFGFSSSTLYLSRGDWAENAAHYGIFGNSSYAIEAAYYSFNGQRPNNELEQFAGSVKFKQHLTPRDSVYIQAIYSDADYGDLRQVYDPNDPNEVNTSIQFEEKQEPILLAGYHHEWAPGSHTLFLGGRLQDTLKMQNPENGALVTLLPGWQLPVAGLPAYPAPNGEVIFPYAPAAAWNYESELLIYTAELQQLWQCGPHSVVAGGRFQQGEFDTRSQMAGFTVPGFAGLLPGGIILTNTGFSVPVDATATHYVNDFQRWNVYGYYNLQAGPVLLTAGAAYDQLYYPENYRTHPTSEEQERISQVSPKLGAIWTLWKDTTVRAAYTRSLGGVSFDQSFRLEPSQVAGFNQSFRSLIPESVAGSIAGADFETYGVALDQKFGRGTYFGIQAEVLSSDAERLVGSVALDLNSPSSSTRAVDLREELEFTERNLLVSVNQLVGKNWAFGARYRLSDAELERRLPDIPVELVPAAEADLKALLHQLTLSGLFYHKTGFFGSGEAVWWNQDNRGDYTHLADEDFWQFNLYVGYRFPNRRAEITLGLLNISDKDYRLNPLNLYPDLPRDRTLLVGFKFHF